MRIATIARIAIDRIVCTRESSVCAPYAERCVAIAIAMIAIPPFLPPLLAVKGLKGASVEVLGRGCSKGQSSQSSQTFTVKLCTEARLGQRVRDCCGLEIV